MSERLKELERRLADEIAIRRHGDNCTSSDLADRLMPFLAQVEREAAARALEGAADRITVFPEQELTDGFDHGADAVYNALRARAAEIREGKNE